MSYNGWKNYETWCVNLWISNDDSIYSDICGEAELLVEQNEYDKEGAREMLSGYIKGMIDDLNPLTEYQASLFSDLLNSSLGEVDYYEIADAFIKEAFNDLKIKQGE